MNKEVVWIFEVKCDDVPWKRPSGGEIIAKVLHPYDEAKGRGIVTFCGEIAEIADSMLLPRQSSI